FPYTSLFRSETLFGPLPPANRRHTASRVALNLARRYTPPTPLGRQIAGKSDRAKKGEQDEKGERDEIFQAAALGTFLPGKFGNEPAQKGFFRTSLQQHAPRPRQLADQPFAAQKSRFPVANAAHLKRNRRFKSDDMAGVNRVALSRPQHAFFNRAIARGDHTPLSGYAQQDQAATAEKAARAAPLRIQRYAHLG